MLLALTFLALQESRLLLQTDIGVNKRFSLQYDSWAFYCYLYLNTFDGDPKSRCQYKSYQITKVSDYGVIPVPLLSQSSLVH